MKIIFLGTSDFSSKLLDFLLENHMDIVAIVTQPDTFEKGRKTMPPVKVLAEKKYAHIPLFQPEKASAEDFVAKLKTFDADFLLVVAYGQILKENLLKLPKKDPINVHASLLPKYRGAAPIHRAILAGERQTGITIMKMVKELDAGDMIAVEKVQIEEEDIFIDVEHKLLEAAKRLLLKVFKDYETGGIHYTPQDNSQATYAEKIQKEDLEIHWDKKAKDLHNQIRAFSLKPGARCKLKINNEVKLLKILRAKIREEKGIPGEILSMNEKEWIVGCQDKSLELLEVQLEGKKPLRFSEFIRGLKEPVSFVV